MQAEILATMPPSKSKFLGATTNSIFVVPTMPSITVAPSATSSLFSLIKQAFSENIQLGSLGSIVLALLIGAATVAIVHAVLYSTVWSTFAKWQRPPVKGRWSWLMGNLIEMQQGNPGDKQMEWTERYGGAVVYRGLLGNERLLISDPRALMYVLQTRCYSFPKPHGARSALSNLLGEGVLTTEGDVHKRQRKIVNPTFSQASVRDFLPLFQRHANALVEHLTNNVREEDQAHANSQPERRMSIAHELSPAFVNKETVENGDVSLIAQKSSSIIDVLHWTSRTTLDVIGESAFSYHLNSLSRGEHGDVIADSFNNMMTHVGQLTMLERAQLHFEQFSIFNGLRPLPTSFNKRARACYDAVQSVAKRMIEDRRNGVAPPETEKDVLERVLRANDDPSLKPSQRLMPHEIMGQLTTLILAGHETTSTALTWALYQLALHPDIQDDVRREYLDALDANDGEDLSYEDIHALPILNNVTNEVMRLNAPVQSTNREAAEDDVIPLSQPILGADGKSIDRIVVRKGQAVIVHIASFNRRKDLWGKDADQFRPSRWDNLPSKVLSSGVPGHSLSFLAGPRNCVGQKFALTEFKTILTALVRAFNFAPPPDNVNVDSKQVIVTRPRIRAMEHAGTQMPLQVTLLDGESS